MKNKLRAMGDHTGNILAFAKVSTKVFTTLAIVLSWSGVALAATVAQAENSNSQKEQVSAIAYLPDLKLQQLAPQSIILSASQPVNDAVGIILQAYKGQTQNISNTGYEVKINPSTRVARINFMLKEPPNAEIFISLRSTSQYVLFEAIKETLLTQPVYNTHKISFSVNGTSFNGNG